MKRRGRDHSVVGCWVILDPLPLVTNTHATYQSGFFWDTPSCIVPFLTQLYFESAPGTANRFDIEVRSGDKNPKVVASCAAVSPPPVSWGESLQGGPSVQMVGLR